MSNLINEIKDKKIVIDSCILLGSKYVDNLDDFISKGEWILSDDSGSFGKHYGELLKSAKPGDLVALKSSYRKVKDLPFNSLGHSIPILEIKAIGKVIENPSDGKTLKIEWSKLSNPKKWYTVSFLNGVTKLEVSKSKLHLDVIDFIFYDQTQDLNYYVDKWLESKELLKEYCLYGSRILDIDEFGNLLPSEIR